MTGVKFKNDKRNVEYLSHRDASLKCLGTKIIAMFGETKAFLRERERYTRNQIESLSRTPFSGEKIGFGDVYCGYDKEEKPYTYKAETYYNIYITDSDLKRMRIGIIFKDEEEKEFLKSIIKRANDAEVPVYNLLVGNRIIETLIGKI